MAGMLRGVRAAAIGLLALYAGPGGGAPPTDPPMGAGPVTQVHIRIEDRVAAFADLDSLARGDGYLVAMVYWYDGSSPVVASPYPLAPSTRFTRELIRYDCVEHGRHRLQQEYFDWPAGQWRLSPYRYPDSLPHEPRDSPQRRIAKLLCTSSPSQLPPDHVTMGAAINSVEKLFGMR